VLSTIEAPRGFYHAAISDCDIVRLVKGTPMKKVALWVAGVAFLGGACYASYSRGFANGNKAVCSVPPGVMLGETVTQDTPVSNPSLKTVQHHYEFKQNGASIYRFDLDTGEACWIQLSQADAGTPMSRCAANPKE
jgi:hypothetical protein